MRGAAPDPRGLRFGSGELERLVDDTFQRLRAIGNGLGLVLLCVARADPLDQSPFTDGCYRVHTLRNSGALTERAGTSSPRERHGAKGPRPFDKLRAA